MEFICNPGFIGVLGNAEEGMSENRMSFCLPNGSWSHPSPECMYTLPLFHCVCVLCTLSCQCDIRHTSEPALFDIQGTCLPVGCQSA